MPHLQVDHLPSLPSPYNDALNDLAIQRFRPSADAVDSLNARLNQTTLYQHDSTSDGAFWTLPPDANKARNEDPELI